jgi:hypothetical protein
MTTATATITQPGASSEQPKPSPEADSAIGRRIRELRARLETARIEASRERFHLIQLSPRRYAVAVAYETASEISIDAEGTAVPHVITFQLASKPAGYVTTLRDLARLRAIGRERI